MGWVFALLVAMGVVLAYRFSDAYRARKSVREALRSAQDLELRVEQYRAGLKTSLQRAASAYTEEVYAERLRAMPLDGLKQHATGLRLQPLRDAGIVNLGDLQGWSESRIGQTRGVGPKSASTIASLVRMMSTSVRVAAVDLPDPGLSRLRERELARAVSLDLAAESALARPAQVWSATLHNKRNEFSDVEKSLGFVRWLTTFGKGCRASEAREMLGDFAEGAPAKTAVEGAFAAAQLAASATLDAASLLATYRLASQAYDDAFAAALKVPGRTKVVAMAPTAGAAIEGAGKRPAEAISQAREQAEASKEDGMKQGERERLASMIIGEKTSSPSGEVAIPPPPRPEFARLVTGPVPGLSRAPQSSAEVLRTFLLAREAQASQHGNPRWVRAGESLVVHGITIARGMLYTSSAFRPGTLMGAVDPGLPVRPAPFLEAGPGVQHGSTYATFTPEQRYQCLQWLAAGASDRSQPAAAMLYFQGLEHRLLAADVAEEERATDRAAVIAEVNRLAELFPESQPGPGDYARRLSGFLATRMSQGAGLPQLPGVEERGDELPFSMRFGLGCFMRDKQPVPLDWMLRWVDLAPNIYLRTPATRCRSAFDAAFTHLYSERYGEGLVIPSNKTMLKVLYRPSNYNLRGPGTEWTFADIPDIAALTVPQGKLRELVDQSTDLIDAYSRFCGRTPGSEGSLLACFTLPRTIWPEGAAQELASLRFEYAKPLRSMSLNEFAEKCGDSTGLNGPHLQDLVGGLEQNSIGVEPDVLGGARRPKAGDSVVFFELTEAGIDRGTAAFRKASLAISLAACVALADGQADQLELEAAERLIGGWSHLHLDLRTRLRAQYRVLISQGANLAALRTKLLALEQNERTEIALDMTRMAAADGVVSPAEVKLLESLYRMLGLPGQELYGNLYGGAERRVPASVAVGQSSGFVLDLARIHLLQQESAEVSDMLGKVFADELDEPAAVPPAALAVPPVSGCSLPGLDVAHAQLLNLLLARPQWQRSEVQAFATRLNLMLDGALERINDAAFEHLDAAIVEGTNPSLCKLIFWRKPDHATDPSARARRCTAVAARRRGAAHRPALDPGRPAAGAPCAD